MSDEYQGVSAPQTEPGQEQPQPPVGAEGDEPKPITKSDLEAFSKALRKDLLDVIRSQTIQSESKIKKEVDAKLTQVENNFKQLKEAGYPVSEDDLKVARSQAISEAIRSLQSTAPEAQPERPYAPDPKEQAVIQQTNESMRAMQKRYGYVLTENDPEYWDVPFGGVSPEDFLDKYEAGLREVVTRLGRPLPAQTPAVNPATRVPTPVGGGDLGSHEEQLNKRLQQIQNTDPFSRDAALTKERTEIKKELEALYINRR